MKISKQLVLAGALVLVSALTPERAVAGMASGEVLANTCFSCHGTDGKSVGAMPTISGKSETFIANKLRSFKSTHAGVTITVMGRIAKGFDDEEIKALSKFFGRK